MHLLPEERRRDYPNILEKVERISIIEENQDRMEKKLDCLCKTVNGNGVIGLVGKVYTLEEYVKSLRVGRAKFFDNIWKVAVGVGIAVILWKLGIG